MGSGKEVHTLALNRSLRIYQMMKRPTIAFLTILQVMKTHIAEIERKLLGALRLNFISSQRKSGFKRGFLDL